MFSLQNIVCILFPPLQRVECGQASWNSPEGSPPSFICVLCPVSPHSPELGVHRWLWHRGPSVETWCWWSEWPVAGGVWGPLQFHQLLMFWHRRYEAIIHYQGVPLWWCQSEIKCILEILAEQIFCSLIFHGAGKLDKQTVSLKLLFVWVFIRKKNVLCRQYRPYHCVENARDYWPAAGPMSPVVHWHGTRSNNVGLQILWLFHCVLARRCSKTCSMTPLLF